MSSQICCCTDAGAAHRAPAADGPVVAPQPVDGGLQAGGNLAADPRAIQPAVQHLAGEVVLARIACWSMAIPRTPANGRKSGCEAMSSQRIINGKAAAGASTAADALSRSEELGPA